MSCSLSAAHSTFLCAVRLSSCPGRCASRRQPAIARTARVTWRRSLSRPWGRWRAGLPKSAGRNCCGRMGIFKSGSDRAPASGRPRRGSPWSAWEFRRGPPSEILQVIARRSPGGREPGDNLRQKTARAAGLRVPGTAHVLDPLKIVQSFAGAARQRGASFECTEVRAIEPLEGGAVLHTTSKILTVDAVVVCTGAWSASLLEPLGLRVPMKAHVAITWRCQVIQRSSTRRSFMSTSASTSVRWKDDCALPASWSLPDTAPHPTRENWRDCERALGTWATIALSMARAGFGHHRCFPTYLPGTVRLDRTSALYAVGHQHIGLTLAPVTGELISDLVADRQPRHDISALDLRRF